MAQVKLGSTVTISYIGTLDDGTIFYSTKEHEPLTITVGADQVFPALEQAIIGMEEGETRNIVLSAEEGYGPRRQENIIQVARSAFPAGKEINVGQKLSIAFSGGQSRIMRVIAVNETEVSLDGNHALAGLELTFALRVDRVA
jgi:FKBP-type peptidyl-prolyl cis-trans isomerase 2